MRRMTAAQFSVKYDGPAISEEHAIDAAVFGSSLMALSELIQEAQDIISPGGPRYRIRVRSTGRGSFVAFMELSEFWDSVKHLFTNQDLQAIAVMVAIFGRDGFLGLMLWLHGRRPDRTEDTDSGTTFWIDERELTVERHIGKLYSSRKVRRSFAAFVQPVTRDTVNELTVEIPDSEPIVIRPDDRPALSVPLEDEPVTDHTTALMLTIEATWWNSVRWYFREPTIGLLWATIGDEAFLRRIRDRTEQFRQGDVLECSVRIRQWDDGPGEGLRSDYTILAVLHHRPSDRGQQSALQ